MNRQSRNAVEKQRKTLRRRARDGLHRVLGAIDALVAADGAQTVAAFRDALDPPALIEAAIACRAYERLEERGHLDAMLARYGTLRQYLPAFFALPFQAAAGSETILRAIEILRALDAGTRGALTTDDPHGFVQADWRPHLITGGKLDRAIWEISLAFAVRDALRAGSLFLAQSRDHVSFWNLVYDDRNWQQAREQAYQRLDLPIDGQAFLARLTAEFDRAVARAAERRHARQPLRRNQRWPAQAQKARCHGDLARAARIARHDQRQPAARAHRRSAAGCRRMVPLHRRLPAARRLSAAWRRSAPVAARHPDRARHQSRPRRHEPERRHAHRRGAAGHQPMVPARRHDQGGQHHPGQSPSRPEAQRASGATEAAPPPMASASRSSGDSLLGSVYPRYFGYYDRALQLYTHTSDQHSVYGTQAISCAPREAGYVLGGILDNDTALAIREHTSDTNGFTEHLFGLCALLGITFMPRLKDLPDQVLSRIDRDADYGALQPLLRGRINVDLILEQWDQLVRLAASLKDRLTPAHVVMQRLANANASDRLAGALTQLGRLMKTLHILRYIQEEPLRDAIQLQLNRGEFRHILAKSLFFANWGSFRSGDYEEVMNKASCLSLLSNAVLVWNTVHIARIVDQLRAAGHEVKDEDLARVSPLAHAHVIPNGSYFQSPRRRAEAAPEPVMA